MWAEHLVEARRALTAAENALALNDIATALPLLQEAGRRIRLTIAKLDPFSNGEHCVLTLPKKPTETT